ncbi:MAG: hypothetical protein GY953_47495 [bacterium]|nr:hypothetical protein [bacterium]
MELLTCLGQIVSDGITDREQEAYLWLLFNEIEAGVTGEIDEAALIEKRSLLKSGAPAGSPRKVAGYAAASLAGTVAEYIHCLWHDVTVREGPEFLPPEPLRKRLELLARWFPPNKGYSLFQREQRCT